MRIPVMMTMGSDKAWSQETFTFLALPRVGDTLNLLDHGGNYLVTDIEWKATRLDPDSWHDVTYVPFVHASLVTH